jgi:hypothetical protein
VPSPVPIIDYDDPKELFAIFGLTFYWAQILEQGIVNLAVALMAVGEPKVTSQVIVDLYSDVDSKTFGRVLQIARGRMMIPVGIDTDLSAALKKRNYLAHRFFVEHDHDIQTDIGRRICIDLLLDDLRFFMRVDAEFDPIWREAWARFGATQDVYDRLLKKLGLGCRSGKVVRESR